MIVLGSGTPLVVDPVPEARRIFENEKTAFFLEKDADVLSQIQSILENPLLQKVGRNGMTLFQKHYSLSRWIRTLLG